MGSRNGVVLFRDLFPEMVEKLGVTGFMKELRSGFGELMDEQKGVITAESLREKMGFMELGEEEAMEMVREGDLDGDGALSEAEFCILMFRLSPGKLAAYTAQQKQDKEEVEENLLQQKAIQLDAFDQQDHGAVPQYNGRNHCRDKNDFHGANSVKVTSYEEEGSLQLHQKQEPLQVAHSARQEMRNLN